MKWLCIVGALLALVGLIKIKLLIYFKSGFIYNLFLKILFFKFLIFSNAVKKKIKKKSHQSKIIEIKEDKNGKSNTKKFDMQSIFEKKELFFLILEPTCNLLKFLNRGFKIKNFNFNLQIAGDDACDAAVSYGRFCWLFGGVFKFFCSVCKVEVNRICVVPVFTTETTSYDFSCCMQISIGRLIFGLIKYFFAIVIKILLNKIKNEGKRLN